MTSRICDLRRTESRLDVLRPAQVPTVRRSCRVIKAKEGRSSTAGPFRALTPEAAER
jgi:hypothetical protein